MPCVAHPRGYADTQYPWNPATDNDPCGLKAVTSVAGVSTAADSLCLFHWGLKYGEAAVQQPIVMEP